MTGPEQQQDAVATASNMTTVEPRRARLFPDFRVAAYAATPHTSIDGEQPDMPVARAESPIGPLLAGRRSFSNRFEHHIRGILYLCRPETRTSQCRIILEALLRAHTTQQRRRLEQREHGRPAAPSVVGVPELFRVFHEIVLDLSDTNVLIPHHVGEVTEAGSDDDEEAADTNSSTLRSTQNDPDVQQSAAQNEVTASRVDAADADDNGEESER
ncbi:hypothetical protein DOTSEDRAFT_50205 [Dothistroma septosporum NZE10]|uniref:Uncharacterized protein n=1 Tax=Dothistroma septosporum (strain NZE10 / CBS 128990) TaxID=675120 RepID=N1Q2U6_DOTSN|nr:hypothetical protein DOTSEDRAFT_50205 [Dothistroma septosporum NZE10]